MGRINVSYPFTFANAPGNQPASRLDENFSAVPDTGILSIRVQELSTGNDYNVEIDDEFSYFVCKGVSDFQIIPPVAPPTGWGFFFSNETRQAAVEIEVTLCCTVFVGNVQYVNPVLIGSFPPHFTNIKGGLVQYDGNQYNFYPLYLASSPGRIVQRTVIVNSDDTGVTITHGFTDPTVTVILLPEWNTQIWQTAQSATQVTFAFSNPVPIISPPTLELTYLVVLA